jgi:hypothetical protein
VANHVLYGVCMADIPAGEQGMVLLRGSALVKAASTSSVAANAGAFSAGTSDDGVVPAAALTSGQVRKTVGIYTAASTPAVGDLVPVVFDGINGFGSYTKP